MMVKANLLLLLLLLSNVNGYRLKRQVDISTKGAPLASSLSSGLSTLQGLLSGALEALQSLLKFKTETLGPALMAKAKAGQTILASPVVKGITDAKVGFLNSAPRLLGTLSGLAGPVVGKTVCTLVCPFQPSEEEKQSCRSKNCGGNAATAPATAITEAAATVKVADNFSDYGEVEPTTTRPR